MSEQEEAEALADASSKALDELLAEHGPSFVPAIIGACVLWAVEHRAVELIKGTLHRAIDLADEMDGAHALRMVQ